MHKTYVFLILPYGCEIQLEFKLLVLECKQPISPSTSDDSNNSVTRNTYDVFLVGLRIKSYPYGSEIK